MKKLKLLWKKPEKKVELEKGFVLIAEHKGDVNYTRYVKFKQLAPQFWERMDSPLFEVYLEKIQDAFDQGKYMKAHALLLDYKLALSQMDDDHDAWGLCFALISYEKDEEVAFVPTDLELKEKLDRMTKQGLTSDMIQEGVMDFMRASPETFQDHLILYEMRNMMTATVE
jgi:hypothetical protein